MSVASTEMVPEPAGGGTGVVPGARPRELRACTAPSRARRMDRRPRPRLRPLAEVLAELGEPPPPIGGGSPARTEDVGGPAWDAALATAAAQVGPLAVGLLTAAAEVLDGRRPLGHLARLCPPSLQDHVRATVVRAAPGFPRGARVRGLRVCPVVGRAGPDGTGTLAVEVAAALRGTQRTRGAAARFELDDTRTWRVTELTVL
jgi:hypothetical protein